MSRMSRDCARELNAYGHDSFAPLFSVSETEIDDRSEMAETETNRASSVAMNAEILWTEARVLEEVQKLQKLSQKKAEIWDMGL